MRPRQILIAIVAVAAVGVATCSMRRAVFADVPSGGSVSAAAPMLEPRSGHTATLLRNGRVLIAGGMRRNQDFYRSAELYDPASGKFEAAGAMNIARVGHAAVLLHSGKVLILGGWVGHDCTDTAEVYDPQSGKFSLTAKMTMKRGGPSATLLTNGDVLIAGGADRDMPGGVRSAEIFRAEDLKFEALTPMHFARISHTATLLNDGRVLIAEGRGDVVNSSAELFNPATKQFTVTGSMLMARYKHSAGSLPGGGVLIAGGSDERDWHGKLNSAEIYDPQTEKFMATSALNESRFKLPEQAVQLTSGKLLIAGGSSKVEVYDPTSGMFLVSSGQMRDARHFMTAMKLKDGNVLLTGGYPDNDRGTAETWIYRP